MITRRDAARGAAITALSYSRILGANDRIGLGLIGAGSRGTYVMGLFHKNSDVEVRALCDVYPARFHDALAIAGNAKTFGDHRKLLELAEVDAVLIGSPDHWHKDHAIDAMTAGKDVYSREAHVPPARRSPADGEGRSRQQQDSADRIAAALRRNLPGAAREVREIGRDREDQPHRRDLARRRAEGAPQGAGPEARRPRLAAFPRTRGVSRLESRDVLQLPLVSGVQRRQDDRLRPPLDGRRAHVHGRAGAARRRRSRAATTTTGTTAARRRTPATRCSSTTVSRCCSSPTPTRSRRGTAITFYGDKGRLFVNRNRWEFTPAGRNVGDRSSGHIAGDITADHVRNFLDCCKSRKAPNADAAIAAISILPPLLAVQSYEEQRRIRFDPVRLEVLPF